MQKMGSLITSIYFKELTPIEGGHPTQLWKKLHSCLLPVLHKDVISTHSAFCIALSQAFSLDVIAGRYKNLHICPC